MLHAMHLRVRSERVVWPLGDNPRRRVVTSDFGTVLVLTGASPKRLSPIAYGAMSTGGPVADVSREVKALRARAAA
jgi:hypothetical protein